MKRGIYCKGCWYDLRGIESGQCPECGRQFNPGRYYTYASHPGTKFPREFWFVLAMQVSSYVLVLLGSLVSVMAEEANTPFEAIGLFLICPAIPVHITASIFGLSVAGFQHDSVAGQRRFWLIVLMLLPAAISLIFLGLLAFAQ